MGEIPRHYYTAPALACLKNKCPRSVHINPGHEGVLSRCKSSHGRRRPWRRVHDIPCDAAGLLGEGLGAREGVSLHDTGKRRSDEPRPFRGRALHYSQERHSRSVG